MSITTKIPIKFHIENDKVIFDEEFLLQRGDMLIEEGLWTEGKGFKIENIFIQRNNFKSKWTMTVDGEEID
jgi:hypothetical protein